MYTSVVETQQPGERRRRGSYAPPPAQAAGGGFLVPRAAIQQGKYAMWLPSLQNQVKYSNIRRTTKPTAEVSSGQYMSGSIHQTV